ncbi:MAG: endonuclease/exonuclease/phosphatase family protein, partial [gamma proteobacterium symbiont of Lucinoma myriamae]|nr:endonuclease/exonuclease/phosphatase family protein [gamma proteobacterium symbiont of Lucinoma myriamae]
MGLISNEITVVQWNARSLCGYNSRNKKCEFYKYLETFSDLPEVVCLQETWNKEGQTLMNLKGYKEPTSFRRKNKIGGGVAIFIKEGLDSEEIKHDKTIENLEFARVRIFGQNSNLDIINVYTNGINKIKTQEYKELLTNIDKKHIIVGDFNIRDGLWDSTYILNSNKRGKEMIKFIEENNLVVLNNGDGTRHNDETGHSTAIDLTLASSDACQGFNWYVHQNTLGSDHFPIVTTINQCHKKVIQGSIPRWNLSKADWTQFSELTKTINIDFDHGTINEKNDQFINELTKICEHTIPKTRPDTGKKRKTLPWWNENCDIAIKKKNKCFKKFKKYKTDQLKEAYRLARAESKVVLDTERKSKWKEFISKLNYKTNSKIIWQTIAKFNGKPFKPVEVLKTNNLRYHENIDKANILAEHYRKTSSDEMHNPIFKNVKKEREPVIDQKVFESVAEGENEEYNKLFTMSEFNTALDKKKSTAPGGDTIHYDMIKNLSEKCKWQVLKLLNQSWAEGKLPDQWKIATIIPLLKPNKPAHDPQSYRPISLTSVLCKLLETMIANRLMTVLEKNDLLSTTQSGFRKNRSTLDQIIRLDSAIKKAKMEKRILVGVFLDLEKAFDLMWTKGVLDQLTRFGIKGRILAWIQDFLKDRKIQVRVGEEMSDQTNLENGSPQGSVLSPILFNVIINTLEDVLKKFPIDLTQFADDSTIWKTAKSPEAAIKILQKALDAIKAWADAWGFKLSGIKTESIIFNRRGKPSKKITRLKIGDQIIEFTTYVKFLGMIFDCTLNWVNHINNIIARCQKDLNLMRYLAGTNYGADKKNLIKLYTTLIRSKIDYGCQAYSTASKTQLKRLDKIQAKALRIATGAYKGTSTTSLNVECNIMPLELRREEMQLKYWARSSPLGDKLPINKLVTNLSLYETQINRLKGRIPYVVKVQDLHVKYNITDQKIQEPTFPEKFVLKSITPRSTLAQTVCKKTDSKKMIKEKTTVHLNRNYNSYLQIYTDGSKDPIKQTSSCAFTIPELHITRKFKLNHNLSVFTTELIAIENALNWILTNEPKKAVILTDSLSAIQALQTGKNHSRPDLIQKINALVDQILRKQLFLMIDWCPAHCNIEGNELADIAAKSGASIGKKIDVK